MKTSLSNVLWVVATVTAIAVTGCKGSGTSCGQVEPCGGVVVGDWKAASSCADSMALSATVRMEAGTDCPNVTIDNIHATASGPLKLNADLTYSMNLSQGGSFDMKLPASCLSGVSCAVLALGIQTELAAAPTAPFKSISCTGSGDCVCHMVLNSAPTNDTGTYTTSGTTLALTSNTDATADASGDYCVKGNTLHLITVDRTMNMGPMGQATIEEDLTFTK